MRDRISKIRDLLPIVPNPVKFGGVVQENRQHYILKELFMSCILFNIAVSFSASHVSNLLLVEERRELTDRLNGFQRAFVLNNSNAFALPVLVPEQRYPSKFTGQLECLPQLLVVHVVRKLSK